MPGTVRAAPKTDVIELLNGDRITCEIRSLDHGKITVKTDGLGTISIEWDDIERFASNAMFDIELDTGSRYFGSFARGASRTADVITAAGVEHLPLDRIVRISPLGTTFWRRLDGSINGGFSFTQANLQTLWTLHADAQYRSRKWYTTLSGDSALTLSEAEDRQTRNSLLLRTRRYLQPLWSVVGFVQLQQNEELSLTLREVLGGGIGRTLAQSNHLIVGVVGGAAYTLENYKDAEVQRARGGGQPLPRVVHVRRTVDQSRRGPDVLLLARRNGAWTARVELDVPERHRRRPVLERQHIRELQRRAAGGQEAQ
jgi:hypothetical protein